MQVCIVHFEVIYTLPVFSKSHRCLSANDELGQIFRDRLLGGKKAFLREAVNTGLNIFSVFKIVNHLVESSMRSKGFKSGVIWGQTKQKQKKTKVPGLSIRVFWNQPMLFLSGKQLCLPEVFFKLPKTKLIITIIIT